MLKLAVRVIVHHFELNDPQKNIIQVRSPQHDESSPCAACCEKAREHPLSKQNLTCLLMPIDDFSARHYLQA